jgi:hypothetical protein
MFSGILILSSLGLMWLQANNFICKKHTLEAYLFREEYHLLIQNMI